jgi:Cft2 family RNA processing exonuclease
MASDIVERLQELMSAEAHEAADEIERLREVIHQYDERGNEVNRVLRERLPEALESAWERGYRAAMRGMTWGDPYEQRKHAEALREIEEN